MQPKRLLALASALGLSQETIAQHLGISRVQVVRWGVGTRPLPEKHLAPLWALIQEAFYRYLDAGKAAPIVDRSSSQRGLTALKFSPQTESIFQAVSALGLEYDELRGEGPTAWITSVRMALDALPDDPRELRKPANTLRLLELSKQLADAALLLAKIRPLQDELEDRTNANDTK